MARSGTAGTVPAFDQYKLTHRVLVHLPHPWLLSGFSSTGQLGHRREPASVGQPEQWNAPAQWHGATSRRILIPPNKVLTPNCRSGSETHMKRSKHEIVRCFPRKGCWSQSWRASAKTAQEPTRLVSKPRQFNRAFSSGTPSSTPPSRRC